MRWFTTCVESPHSIEIRVDLAVKIGDATVENQVRCGRLRLVNRSPQSIGRSVAWVEAEFLAASLEWSTGGGIRWGVYRRSRVGYKTLHPMSSLYRELQVRCKELGLAPCNAPIDVLRSMIDESERRASTEIGFGVRDMDKLIYLHLDAQELLDACNLSHYTQSVCDESFWIMKNRKEFGYAVRSHNQDVYAALWPLDELGRLLWACKHGHVALIKQLATKGAKIHYNDELPLRYAAKAGQLAVVEYLVLSGANIRARDNLALRWAAWGGDVRVIRFLVERGADIHADHDDAVVKASLDGRLDAIKYLVSRGADIYTQGDKAMEMSIQYGHSDVVDYLVAQYGVNIDYVKGRFLLLAVKSGQLDLVEYFDELGADIHTGSDTALFLAAKHGHLDIFAYLIARGADIHANNTVVLRAAIHSGNIDLVDYILSHGVDIHFDDDYAVRDAAENGQLDLVKYLVSQGANIHALNNYATRIAVANNHSRVVHYLRALASADPTPSMATRRRPASRSS